MFKKIITVVIIKRSNDKVKPLHNSAYTTMRGGGAGSKVSGHRQAGANF